MVKDVLNESLLEKMVKQEMISADAMGAVLHEHKNTGKPISEILLAQQLITEKKLVTFICQEFDYTPIGLNAFVLDQDVLNMVPGEFALKNWVLPVSRYENTLTVAMKNPTDVVLIDDLQLMTNMRIKPVVAPTSELEKALRKYYSHEREEEVQAATNPEETIEDLIRIVQDSKSDNFQEQDLDLEKQAQETPVIKVANYLLVDAIKRKASDLFIEPWEKHIRVRFRVDGILEEGKAPSKVMGQALVSRFKVMSQLNIAEMRIPQDGRFKIKVQDREVDVRLSIIPSSYGEKVCLRILDKKAQSQSLERLGFTSAEMEEIKAMAVKPHGMILVTGPTGSGKTTTLYSVLKYLDSPEKNITTVEDPVEYQVEGINQVNVKDQIGLNFPIALRSILRQDPDVILIGEIRDRETMDIAIKAALTGHLVLSTLHTNDTCSSIIRIINMGIEPFLISSSVLMVSAQRLIRRLCMSCRIPYTPDEKLLKRLRLNLDEKFTFYRSKSCPRCRHTGYAGRTVITEILVLKPEIKEIIMKRVSADEIKNVARKNGMSTLRESAVRKVVAGETTVDELFRVTTGDQDLDNDLIAS